MNRKILESHVEFGGPNKVIVAIAVETEPGMYEAFQRVCSDVSNYDLTLVLQYGTKLEDVKANFLFPALVREKGYKYDSTEIVGSNIPVDRMVSLASLQEGIKEELYSMVLTNADDKRRQAILEKVTKMRELAAPFMIKNFETQNNDYSR